jgi:hypothetical protein
MMKNSHPFAQPQMQTYRRNAHRRPARRITSRNQPWQNIIQKISNWLPPWSNTEQALHALMSAFYDTYTYDRILDEHHTELAIKQFQLEISNAMKNKRRPIHWYAGPSQRELIKDILLMDRSVGEMCIVDHRDNEDGQIGGYLTWNCGDEDPMMHTNVAWNVNRHQQITSKSSPAGKHLNSFASVPRIGPRRSYHPYKR